jgi:hypothetical protein
MTKAIAITGASTAQHNRQEAGLDSTHNDIAIDFGRA